MITEIELCDLLHDIADEAPEKCTSLAIGRPGPRRFFLPGAAAAAVVIVAGAAAAAVGFGPGAGPDRVTRPSNHRVTAAATAIGSTPVKVWEPVPMVVPNAKQRHQLLTYALNSAKINGDPNPMVHVVWTTFDRAYKQLPMTFNIGPETKEAREFQLASTHAGVWVIWYQGHFGQGNSVMVDLVSAKNLKGGMGTFHVDSGDGVDPNIVLAPLGRVVRLT